MNKEEMPAIEVGVEDRSKNQERGVDRSKMSECYGLSESPEKSQPHGSISTSVECQATPMTNEHGIAMTNPRESIRQEIASRVNGGETDFQADQFIIRDHDDIQSEVDSLPEIANKPGEYPVVQSQQELVELYSEAFEENLSFSPAYVFSSDPVEDEGRRLVDKKVKEALEAQVRYNQQSAQKTAEAVRKDQLARFQKILKEKKSAGIDTVTAEKSYQRAFSDSNVRVDEEFDSGVSESNKEKS